MTNYLIDSNLDEGEDNGARLAAAGAKKKKKKKKKKPTADDSIGLDSEQLDLKQQADRLN